MIKDNKLKEVITVVNRKALDMYELAFALPTKFG